MGIKVIEGRDRKQIRYTIRYILRASNFNRRLDTTGNKYDPMMLFGSILEIGLAIILGSLMKPRRKDRRYNIRLYSLKTMYSYTA